ncbi:hypothetical protein OG735_37010 [Streptomyces sp. NBC_01210]|uniref:hypothetical protein n=1 Tax=Streptomyces sp. NBC_01210 TaxID=2903774 RepID=UPI002E151F55|nr:hypothetical protein OG735_37010 [Streptomyces sp. NBC_01210]
MPLTDWAIAEPGPWGGVPSDRKARWTMHRLTAAVLTAMAAAVLAVGAAFGIVAALNVTPEQPNVPLVSFETGRPTASPQP